MSALRLQLRTPTGLLIDAPVLRVVAEDLDGWFGLAPGRADLIAALPPGLLVFRGASPDRAGEWFVAHAGGLLNLEGGVCRVMCRQATLARDLADIEKQLDEVAQDRRARRDLHEGVMQELVREALRRMAREATA